MNKALSMLALTKKAGSLEIGEEASGALVRSGKARLLVLAADASGNAQRRAEGFVYGTNTPLITLPFTKLELSNTLGKAGCSMAAFSDVGLAASFAAALALDDAESYGAISEELRQKEEKFRQRKAEAQAHVKNKRFGKKRKHPQAEE